MSGSIAFAAPDAGRRLVLGLVSLIVALDLAFVATLALHRFGPDITELKLMFDLGRESNVPTWANTMLLLAVSSAFLVVAGLSLPDERPSRRSLVAAGVIVGLLSIDEAAQIHELAGSPTSELLDRIGVSVTTYAWVIPGSILAACLGVVAWRWSATLPADVRRRLTIAFGMYVGAAVGVEAVNGWLVRQDAEYPYVLGTLVEESIEMGACIVALTGIARLTDVSACAVARRRSDRQ